MKKCLLLIVAIFGIVSCETGDQNSTEKQSVNVKSDIGKVYREKILQYEYSQGSNAARISITDQTNGTKLVEDSEVPGYHAVTVRAVNYNPSDFETKAYYFDEKDEIYAVSILHAVKNASTNKTTIDMYDENYNYLLTTTMNNTNSTLLVTNSRAKNCGQLVADCLSDMYTNNGWDSVGLSVLSAFFPEAIVAAALICIKRKC